MARSSRFALDGAATQCDGLRADHIELAGAPPFNFHDQGAGLHRKAAIHGEVAR